MRKIVAASAVALSFMLAPAAFGGEARMLRTAYAPGCGDGGRTATGTRPHWGTVAVDPRVIPLGSRVWVEGYGFGIAEDTGGAIIGDHVDVWMSSCSSALRATRYSVRVRWWPYR